MFNIKEIIRTHWNDVKGNAKWDFTKWGLGGYDNNTNWINAMSAWDAGDYPYCALFLSRSAKNDPDGAWQRGRIYLAASILAENPTSDGYRQFYKTLGDVVSKIQQEAKTGTVFRNPADSTISNVIWDLGKVKDRLPLSQGTNIDNFIQQLRATMKETNN